MPPVPTNSIEICYDDFVIPEVDITIGDCNRNNPNNNIFSDDYYYVNFNISNADYVHWTLKRKLDDTLPGESGRYFLNTTGYGNDNLDLGPFLIQDGSWILILNYNHCSDTFQITPLDYCSGCPQLSKAKIFDIACTQGNNWTYTIEIPLTITQGDFYRIGATDYQFNTSNVIIVGSIGYNCIYEEVKYYTVVNGNPRYECSAFFDICPPRKCLNNSNCYVEAYFKKLNCINNGSSYSLEIEAKGASSPCYSILDNNGDTIKTGTYTFPLGPFTSDINLVICTTGSPTSCDCTSSNCYKALKIRQPKDCNRNDFSGIIGNDNLNSSELSIIPNPVRSEEFIIRSILSRTSLEIFTTSGLKLYSNSFDDKEFKLNLSLESGIYYLKYKNSEGRFSVIKFLKL